MADDRSPAPPFVADFLQVSMHSIATLYMIVHANFAMSRWGTIEIRQQLCQVVFAENLKGFA